MRELGVGLVYWPALEPLLQAPGSAISVVELEPQTLWTMASGAAGGWHYRNNDELLERVACLPQAKLVHGVGHPLGGSVSDPIDPARLMRQVVDRLDPAWVSEHLSFNRVERAGTVEHAGFLLPPPQTPAAARVAAHNIAAFRQAMSRPVAFETGVNYLQPRDGEMQDGDFFAEVARVSGSGIVLDLHNLWCNERNGRQSVAETLACLPLDRVWEIHLAGGLARSGYWLDAHSGSVPPEVIEIAARLIPDLPNLGALIFEVLPEHLAGIGLDGVQRQLESLQQLWALRRPRPMRPTTRPDGAGGAILAAPADVAEVARWETELVAAMRAANLATAATSSTLRADPGSALLQGLVDDFRRANLARALHYTMTSLLAALGAQETNALLDVYFDQHPPEPFAAVEADGFARFLRQGLTRLPPVAFLDEVLSFEHALIAATIHGESAQVAWSADPVLLFEALDAGRLPANLPAVSSTMRISAG